MDIKIPEVGESIREALLAKWFKKNGEQVVKDEPLCEIETDKITLDINADASGTLSIAVSEGTTVKIGTIVGTISEQGSLSSLPQDGVVAGMTGSGRNSAADTVSSPSVRREMREKGIDPDSVTGTGKGGRITLDDLLSRIEDSSRRPTAPLTEPVQPVVSSPAGSVETLQASFPVPGVRAEAGAYSQNSLSPQFEAASLKPPLREERKPMSPIRLKISEHMVAARQKTAMLTTFNEADLSHVIALRSRYRDHFQSRHGIRLGFMPFFVKACCEALREFPAVNARIDGNDIVFQNYYDIGVAIGAEKGLVVPILRNADRMRFHEIEQAIVNYSEKIKTNRIAISDLDGGTFSISNGGVYGSMLSTPILNPPQSAVLGMHAIQERAVVVEGQIVIRPMMYLALSYDHRIIDGREAVGFLKKVKEFIEEPEELLLES
jgi:2-oxoglutarate dehydrogenase E2 component (dihydrolipoamide succinyltransferase)